MTAPPHRRDVIAGLAVAILASANAFAATGRKPTNALSVRDLGAIGDGTSHPVREWIPRRFATLAAIQQAYPDVTSLDDEIDFAALNLAVRLAANRRTTVWLPPGVYRGWIYVQASNVAIAGAGAAHTVIKLPDNALHSQLDEPGRTMLTGVPPVIDVGGVSRGHNARPCTAIAIHGLTLDGNRSRVRPPQIDLFGWGLAFTRASHVDYDIAAVNCHAGGVGTFIVSTFHNGRAIVSDCGYALGHPGFDINSSQNCTFDVVVRRCAYGIRLLDNCSGITLRGTIENAAQTGLVYGNQPGTRNSSARNDVTVTIAGGCRDAGVNIGAKCSASRITASISRIEGIGIHELAQADAADVSHNNSYIIKTFRCGAQSVLIHGTRGRWSITSREDGHAGPVGAFFAIDVYGQSNTLSVDFADIIARRTRAIVFRNGSGHNHLLHFRSRNALQTLLDQGISNIASVS